jgi:hypothetical protein
MISEQRANQGYLIDNSSPAFLNWGMNPKAALGLARRKHNAATLRGRRANNNFNFALLGSRQVILLLAKTLSTQ